MMSNSLVITKDTKVLVGCPANIATGGPELLHQLVYELTKLGFDAYMYYYSRVEGINPVNTVYTLYKNKFVDYIEDTPNNILIMPETKTGLLYNYHNIQKIIWWLSVDNHFNFLNAQSILKKYIKLFLYKLNYYPRYSIYRFNRQDNIIHFVQSEYANQMLKSRGIRESFFLGDYLNKLFIEQQAQYLETKKENIVLYNPKKGVVFTKKLITKAKKIQFIAIENMSREEVSKLLSKAKVYIDFGNHPGKDRIPREAAISNCCVITGMQGSAKYYKDVAIDDEFKFNDTEEDLQLIINKIIDCFENYKLNKKKFAFYRNKINKEQNEFISDIRKIFIKNYE